MKPKSRTEAKSEEIVQLRLYVAGQSPRSLAAISNLEKICSQYLDSGYRLEVIDLMKNPALARDHQILAIPTLVRSLPSPIRKIIGDLSDTERVVVGLDVRFESKKKASKQQGGLTERERRQSSGVGSTGKSR